jgi:hypothetical protein
LSLGKARSVSIFEQGTCGDGLRVFEARGIIDGGLESQTHERAHARYGRQSPAGVILARDLREMPIELHVLPAWRSF